MPNLSERVVCTKFITLALKIGGDIQKQIIEEVPFSKGHISVKIGLSHTER